MFVIFLSTPFLELFTIIRFGLLVFYKYLQYSMFFLDLKRFSIIWEVIFFIEKLVVIRSERVSNLGWALKNPLWIPV